MDTDELTRGDGLRRLAEAGCMFVPLNARKRPKVKFDALWSYDDLTYRLLIGDLDSLPAVGAVLGKGLLALDLDSPEHARRAGRPETDGFSNAKRWLTAKGYGDRFPLTLAAKTGSGGLHLYYRIPCEDPEIRNGSRLGAPTLGQIETGIDAKTNKGYCLLPGSEYLGWPYRWFKDAPIADATPAVIALVKDRHKKQYSGLYSYSGGAADYDDNPDPPDDEMVAAMEELLLQLPCELVTLSEWVSVAGALRAFAYPFRLFDEWSQRDIVRYDDGRHLSTWETWLSVADRPVLNGSTIATIVALAKSYNPDFRMPQPFVDRWRCARIRQALAALDDD